MSAKNRQTARAQAEQRKEDYLPPLFPWDKFQIYCRDQKAMWAVGEYPYPKLALHVLPFQISHTTIFLKNVSNPNFKILLQCFFVV
tara:strand:+ start:2440 stop:2697 length:258 start_codon:yes stop_codon:yes gene_type:complete